MIATIARSLIVAALSVGTVAGAAQAQGIFVGPPLSTVSPQPLTGKRGEVARELPTFGYADEDVAIMSDRTVALLDNAIHGGGSHGRRADRIGSILSNGGFVQRALDRAFTR